MSSSDRAEKCDEEESLQILEKAGRLKNASHSDDLLKMGRYSIFLCIFVEVAMLSQLSNTMLMVYAGKFRFLI
ncbi:hypothetical protein B9Z55_019322 [Caenorhabditis nigoni]|uniref:Uncharacterized protein n=1 Tax=Caenorhabditis nigoni TaxID=1611254 RepID=A0A2G5THY3_9PELO|nr:hypothetical protein B9Z55_019322 [Caenorhabditis nigoni]